MARGYLQYLSHHWRLDGHAVYRLEDNLTPTGGRPFDSMESLPAGPEPGDPRGDQGPAGLHPLCLRQRLAHVHRRPSAHPVAPRGWRPCREFHRSSSGEGERITGVKTVSWTAVDSTTTSGAV
jgi:hypothetical protein